MHPVWKQESDLARALENDRALGCANSPVMAGFQFHEEDLAILDQILPALQNVQKRVGHNHEHYLRVGELIEFVQHLRKALPTQTPEQAFECIQTLRQWLFWHPPAMLRGESIDLNTLAVIAQFYGVGIAVDGLFPNMGGAYLGPLCIRPSEEIRQIIETRVIPDSFGPGPELSLSLIQLPRHLAEKYRNHLHWSPRTSTGNYSPDSSSPYNAQDYRVSSSSPSSSATYAPYTPPLQSPPAVTIASSPTDVAGTCVTAPTPLALYPSSPRLLPRSRELPAFSQSDVYHSAGYAPAYAEQMVCGLPRAEGPIRVDSGMYTESHPAHVGGLVAAETCWT